MASNANEHDKGDNALLSHFGQFVRNEMSPEIVDRILWVLKEQRLDRIPSVEMQFFLQFAAVQFVAVRFKVRAL